MIQRMNEDREKTIRRRQGRKENKGFKGRVEEDSKDARGLSETSLAHSKAPPS